MFSAIVFFCIVFPTQLLLRLFGWKLIVNEGAGYSLSEGAFNSAIIVPIQHIKKEFDFPAGISGNPDRQRVTLFLHGPLKGSYTRHESGVCNHGNCTFGQVRQSLEWALEELLGHPYRLLTDFATETEAKNKGYQDSVWRRTGLPPGTKMRVTFGMEAMAEMLGAETANRLFTEKRGGVLVPK